MLWPWWRLAAAAPIRLLAWDLPYGAGAAVKREKKKLAQSHTQLLSGKPEFEPRFDWPQSPGGMDWLGFRASGRM